MSSALTWAAAPRRFGHAKVYGMPSLLPFQTFAGAAAACLCTTARARHDFDMTSLPCQAGFLEVSAYATSAKCARDGYGPIRALSPRLFAFPHRHYRFASISASAFIMPLGDGAAMAAADCQLRRAMSRISFQDILAAELRYMAPCRLLPAAAISRISAMPTGRRFS